MAAPCPNKNCCSTCVATLLPGVVGCPSWIFPGNPVGTGVSGISWTATQGGSVVASGTTGAGGSASPFTVSSTAAVTMSYSGLGLAARVGSGTFNVTPVCGSSVGAAIQFGFFQQTGCTSASTATYVCVCNCNAKRGPNCVYPIKAALIATTGLGSGTATYTQPQISGQWQMSLPDGSGGNYVWNFVCGSGSASNAATLTHFDSGGAVLGTSTGTMSVTCPTASGIFSASGSVSGTAGSASWALSE